jgi:hypothetical protein
MYKEKRKFTVISMLVYIKAFLKCSNYIASNGSVVVSGERRRI